MTSAPACFGIVTGPRGRSSVAELQLPKLIARVRFSSPALSSHTRPHHGNVPSPQVRAPSPCATRRQMLRRCYLKLTAEVRQIPHCTFG